MDKFYLFCLRLYFVCIIESVKLEKTLEVIESSLWLSVGNTCLIVSSIVSVAE